jgi:hypothetical protein
MEVWREKNKISNFSPENFHLKIAIQQTSSQRDFNCVSLGSAFKNNPHKFLLLFSTW